MNTRRCVCCRKKRSPNELFRLRFDSHQLIHTSKSHGRSIWVCWSKKCLHKLQQRPQIIRRSLRFSPKKIPDILQQARFFREDQRRQSIAHLHQSGLVVSGPVLVRQNISFLSMLLFAQPHHLEQWRPDVVPTYCLHTTSAEMGSWIGKGSRFVLGIIRTRYSSLLEEHLRICNELR